MESVKYTRREYRSEFLSCPDWLAMRDAIMSSSPSCFRDECEKSARDLHHLIYRKDVHATRVTDVVPLCRACHTLIHKAIDNRIIRFPNNWAGKVAIREHREMVKTKTAKSITDNLKWLNMLSIVGDTLAAKIRQSHPSVSQRMRGYFRVNSLQKIEDIRAKNRVIAKAKRIIDQCSTENGLKAYLKSIGCDKAARQLFSHPWNRDKPSGTGRKQRDEAI